MLKELAPKYGKDHKMSDNDAAYNAMIAAVCAGGPSTKGTTVSLVHSASISGKYIKAKKKKKKKNQW